MPLTYYIGLELYLRDTDFISYWIWLCLHGSALSCAAGNSPFHYLTLIVRSQSMLLMDQENLKNVVAVVSFAFIVVLTQIVLNSLYTWCKQVLHILINQHSSKRPKDLASSFLEKNSRNFHLFFCPGCVLWR